MSVAIEVEAMIKATVETYRRLDYAFNNAGCGNLVRGLEAPEEAWDKVSDTTLKGVWLCMKYEIPEMLKAGGGVIVNNSSISGVGGSLRRYQYVASKHGVNGLTKCAAIEYAEEGIRVNAVVPGIIETPMWGGLHRSTKQNWTDRNPSRAWAEQTRWQIQSSGSVRINLHMSLE